MQSMIYLDNAATTKVSEKVKQAMLPFFDEFYGNASSLYVFGQRAKEKLEEAKKHFNSYILTSAKNAQSANYPFCTIEPNVGIVPVPDERLDVLGKMYNTKKITPAILKFVDIAGLVKGASQGEGLGNKFLSHIREVDAIVQVVRCFDDVNTIHVNGKVDPIDDIETINAELALADLATLENILTDNPALRNDSKFMTDAIQKDPSFLELAAKELKDDFDFMRVCKK